MSEGSVNEGHEAQAGATATSEKDPPYPSNLYAWYCVIVLLGIYLNSFLDRQILGLVVDPMKTTMNISDSQVGILMGLSFALLYTTAGLPLGYLADRVSRRWLIVGGQAFWSVASVCFGLSRDYTQMLLARVGVGVGEASLSPSAYSFIADIFPPDKLGRALSVYGMGIYMGGGLANLIGGQLLGSFAPDALHNVPLAGERFGWQIIFFVIALPTIPLTILMMTLREPIRRGVGMVRDAAGNLRPQTVPVGQFFRYWWRNKRALLSHNVGFAFLSFSGYGAGFWMPTFFQRVHDWTPEQAGTNLGLVAMTAGPIGLFIGGWIGDWLNRKGHTDSKMRAGFIASTAWFPFGIAVLLVPDGDLALWLMVPTTIFAAMPWGIAPAAIQEVMPNQMRGQASAVYLFILNLIGLGLGPTAVGFITDGVFGDPQKVHLSLLITTAGAHVVSSVLLFSGFRAFRESQARREAWQPEAAA
ncbi:MAG: MFS transporter [Myxococcales bacterium]|nr:MFS transporter [Myxococcales bacterium]